MRLFNVPDLTGACFSASIYVAIQTNELTAKLPGQVSRAVEETGFTSSSVPDILAAIKSGAGIDSVQGMTESVASVLKEAVKTAYAMSYKTTYLSSLAWGGIALICCFLASNDMENYFTSYINKTVDTPHIEASERADVEKSVAKQGEE